VDLPRKVRVVWDISQFVEQRNAALVGATLGGKEVGRLWELRLIQRILPELVKAVSIARIEPDSFPYQTGQVYGVLFNILVFVPPTAQSQRNTLFLKHIEG